MVKRRRCRHEVAQATKYHGASSDDTLSWFAAEIFSSGRLFEPQMRKPAGSSRNCCEAHEVHTNGPDQFHFRKTKRGVVAHFFGGSSPLHTWRREEADVSRNGTAFVDVCGEWPHIYSLIMYFEARKVNKPIIIKRKWNARQEEPVSFYYRKHWRVSQQLNIIACNFVADELSGFNGNNGAVTEYLQVQRLAGWPFHVLLKNTFSAQCYVTTWVIPKNTELTHRYGVFVLEQQLLHYGTVKWFTIPSLLLIARVAERLLNKLSQYCKQTRTR